MACCSRLQAKIFERRALEESMSGTATAVPVGRGPELLGQTVVVIGGSSGMGLETARRARVEGARLILTARDPELLKKLDAVAGRVLGR